MENLNSIETLIKSNNVEGKIVGSYKKCKQ